jgi:hypothetical protein
MPEDGKIWVIKILAFMSWIYLVSLRIFFISSIYSLYISEGIFSKTYQYTQEKINNRAKLVKTKNRTFQLISNKFSSWTAGTFHLDEDIRISNLLAKGLGARIQDNLCKNWKEDNLWCMTKYKPVGKKVRPVNQAMPQSINPPLQRPPLSRDPYKTPLTPHPPEFQPTWKITEECLGVISFGPEGWL